MSDLDAGALLAARIAARTAHDLNNLVAVLSGHIYLLRNSAESVEEATDAIEKALAHLERLARSLTAVGSIGLEEAAMVDVNEVVRAVARSLGGSIELDLAPEPVAVQASKRDLSAAIEALLANAREAPGPRAPVRVLTRAEAGFIAITVEDSGPGVAPTVRQRNFDPLFSTKGEKGRGVGLTIARLAAALHGGTIIVADRLGAAPGFPWLCPRLRARSPEEPLPLALRLESRDDHARRRAAGSDTAESLRPLRRNQKGRLRVAESRRPVGQTLFSKRCQRDA